MTCSTPHARKSCMYADICRPRRRHGATESSALSSTFIQHTCSSASTSARSNPTVTGGKSLLLILGCLLHTDSGPSAVVLHPNVVSIPFSSLSLAVCLYFSKLDHSLMPLRGRLGSLPSLGWNTTKEWRRGFRLPRRYRIR